MQFEAMKRGDRHAIGGSGGRLLKYIPAPVHFSPDQRDFFLSRPLGSARYFDRVLCSFYQNYLVHWFIPFSLPLSLSFSLSHSRVVARFVINVEITAREFQRGIGCHLLDRESTMNRSNLLFSREKRNRWMFQSGIRE